MLEPNSILQDRYRVIKPLGKGGMGAVYEAIDQRVKSTVVLKRTLSAQGELGAAFEREARLLANLRHPALPKVMDHFVEDDGQYLVMEYIPGQDLWQMLRALGRPFAPADVLRWADELLRVLEYLHRHNPPILHRDIKPANLKLTDSGEIFLLDFGLAKGAAGQMTTVRPGVRSVAGYTPNYAPLEQILRSDNQHPDRPWVENLIHLDAAAVERIVDAPTDERADLYSLGATLYQLLTNEPPTHAGRRALYLWRGQEDPVRTVSELNPLVPEEVAAIIASAMELHAEQRPPSAVEMRAALRDAAQSLRVHTGAAALRQLPPEVFDAIVRRVAEQLEERQEQRLAVIRDEHEKKLSELRYELKQTRDAFESRVYAHDRTLEYLDYKVGGLAARLDDVTKATDDLRGIVGQKPKHVSPEEEQRIINAAIEALNRVLPERREAAPQPQPKQTPPPAASAPAPEVRPANPQTVGPPVRSEIESAYFPVELDAEERVLHYNMWRFASLLVSEIKLYNEQKVRDGRINEDLYDRLREDISKSRQLYAKRVNMTDPEVASRYDYFHHELVRTLAEGDPAKLGKNYPGPTAGR